MEMTGADPHQNLHVTSDACVGWPNEMQVHQSIVIEKRIHKNCNHKQSTRESGFGCCMSVVESKVIDVRTDDLTL